jgi:hypothetical protein
MEFQVSVLAALNVLNRDCAAENNDDCDKLFVFSFIAQCRASLGSANASLVRNMQQSMNASNRATARKGAAYMIQERKKTANGSRAERVTRIIVAIMTCLGALGFAALLYFPLQYLK